MRPQYSIRGRLKSLVPRGSSSQHYSLHGDGLAMLLLSCIELLCVFMVVYQIKGIQRPEFNLVDDLALAGSEGGLPLDWYSSTTIFYAHVHSL